MKSPINITLGSTSSHKIDAVHQACQRLCLKVNLRGVKTQSGQNEQPVGPNETFNGALMRALSAQSSRPETVAIGIESGIFSFGPETTLDIAVIVVLTLDGRQIVTTSEGVQFPEEYVTITRNCGFRAVTVGSIIAEELAGDPADPHSILTKGKVTRTMTLVDALVIALRQL